MDLSIILVNYNVKYFLEQCLCSICKAVHNIDSEIFVVDNCSSDNSLEYLRPRFPSVQFIANSTNSGFAKANNQALEKAVGKMILFINPDTIIPEDSLVKCMEFLNADPEAGALGVKMLDGTGRFLKESKRAFPSPFTSFFKLVGLARIFPHSKWFGKYHLGYLDPDQNHEMDVLAGAFIMVKSEVIQKTGGFDESFFMYGEDIDLSYRIQQAGYKNFYFSGTAIIHFKGESTRKGSLNYVRLFYKAMSQFVKKHYQGARGRIFRWLIEMAIWGRAFLTALGTFMKKLGWPLVDAVIILVSFWLVKFGWNRYVKPEINYSTSLLTIALPAFTIIYLISAYYAGLYDRYKKKYRIIPATLIATLVVLAVYSLLPENYRFSRAIILLGSILSFFLMSLLRIFFRTIGIMENGEPTLPLQTVVVGSAEEYRTVVKLMQESGRQGDMLGRIAPVEDGKEKLTILEKLDDFLRAVPVKEVIFCEGTLTYKSIIRHIQNIRKSFRIRIFSAGSGGIVGSDSKYGSGSIISNEVQFNLNRPSSRRMKRLFDLGLSLFLLVSFPVQLFLVRKPFGLILNIFLVLFGKRTWIGYGSKGRHLPRLRKGVLSTNGGRIYPEPGHEEAAFRIDYRYSLEYTPSMDLRLVLANYLNLGGGTAVD